MSVDACAALVQSADPVRFRAAMTAPMPLRGDLMVLYAFNVEVSRAPWVTQEPMIAHMRLQWWIDALKEIESGTARRHEVVTPLCELATRHRLDLTGLARLVEARGFDIERAPHENRDEFLSYIKRTYACLMGEALRLCGQDEAGVALGQKIGLCSGVAAQFTAFHTLYERGRDPLWGNAHDRTAASRGTPDTVSIDMVSELAQQMLDTLQDAKRSLRNINKQGKPALLVGYDTERVLRLVVQRPATVFTPEFADRGLLADQISFLKNYWLKPI